MTYAPKTAFCLNHFKILRLKFTKILQICLKNFCEFPPWRILVLRRYATRLHMFMSPESKKARSPLCITYSSWSILSLNKTVVWLFLFELLIQYHFCHERIHQANANNVCVFKRYLFDCYIRQRWNCSHYIARYPFRNTPKASSLSPSLNVFFSNDFFCEEKSCLSWVQINFLDYVKVENIFGCLCVCVSLCVCVFVCVSVSV